MRRAALSVFIVAALTCLVSGQQPAIKTITAGVVVDVTVVDGKGNAVLDLAPEDFEVSEDGVRQRVVSATLVQRGVVRPLAAAGSDQTAGREPERDLRLPKCTHDGRRADLVGTREGPVSLSIRCKGGRPLDAPAAIPLFYSLYS